MRIRQTVYDMIVILEYQESGHLLNKPTPFPEIIYLYPLNKYIHILAQKCSNYLY